MRKPIILFSFVLACIISFAFRRTVPSTALVAHLRVDTVPISGIVPQPFAYKWYKFYNYAEVDSGIMLEARDTNFIPRKPTLILFSGCGCPYFYSFVLHHWIKVALGSGGGGGGGISEVDAGYCLTQVNDSTVAVDTACIAATFLRIKDSLTSTNPLGYVTKTVLGDSGASIRSAFPAVYTDSMARDQQLFTSFDRSKYHTWNFNNRTFIDSEMVAALHNNTSIYFNKGLIVNNNYTGTYVENGTELKGLSYGDVDQQNWAQRLIFQVLDSTTTLRIAFGLHGDELLLTKVALATIEGTVGDSANTYLKNRDNNEPFLKKSGVLINKGDYIELSIVKVRDSVVAYYRNLVTGNTQKLARIVHSNGTAEYSGLISYPLVYVAQGRLRLIDYAITKQEDANIFFLGNSITEGYGASRWDSAWVYRLARESNAKILNIAQGGACTYDYLKLKNDLSFRNKTVVLSAVYGTSLAGGRTYDQSKSDYDSLVRLLRSRSNKIIHIKTTYRPSILGGGGWAEEAKLNRWIDTAYFGIDPILTFDSLPNTAPWYYDGIHFTATGQDTMYKQFKGRFPELFNSSIVIGDVDYVPHYQAASISNDTLTLHEADATHPGVLSQYAQEIGGDKTLKGNALIASNFANHFKIILPQYTLDDATVSGFGLIKANSGSTLLSMYTHGGNASEFNQINIIAKGTPTDVTTNLERMIIGFNNGGYWQLQTAGVGTGIGVKHYPTVFGNFGSQAMWIDTLDNVSIGTFAYHSGIKLYVAGVGTFTSTVNGITETTSDSTTKLASTEFVHKAIAAGGGGGGGIVYVDSIWRTPGIDSIYWRKNGTTYKILDSLGSTTTLASVGGGLDIQSGGLGNVNTLYASDFDVASNLIKIDYTNGQAADASHKGFLTSTDWSTFNGKIDGSGTSGRVAYWNGPSSLASSSEFLFDPAGFAGEGLLTITGTANYGTISLTQTAGNFLMMQNSTFGNYIQASGSKDIGLYFGGSMGTVGATHTVDFKNGGDVQMAYSLYVGAFTTPTALVDIAASTTSKASLRIEAGTAPTSPNDGDIYNKSSTHHLYTYLNGAEYQLDQQRGVQGASIASANNLTLGSDGNTFEITGTTQINLISNVGYANGAVVRLMFTSTPTVKTGQTTSGTNIKILLAGALDFAATADDVLVLELSTVGGVQAWREISRTVN